MLKQHVLVELKQFIQAVTSYRNNPKKLTNNTVLRTSFHLLEDLPAARDIVFEYFALVAEVAVQSYVATANVDQAGLPIPQPKNGPPIPQAMEDTTFGAVQEVLENLVSKGPAAWGPIIASWSLDLVSDLSDKYTKRKMPIASACNFWLSCSAMRGLLTLISISFRKLTNAEAESCVETLLGAFERYSLTFDWVVARLGGCFPLKIISQILQCSLKRFVDDYRSRFDSEIGILDYLSFAHVQELKKALREMLQEGFQPKKNLDASIIPYLMVISNYSDVLLENLVSVFLEMYNDELRDVIIQKAPLWISNKVFAEMQPSLNNIALRLKTNGVQLLITVSKMADQYSWCQDFLEFNLQELEQIILNARICPLMNDLSTEESKYLLWKSCSSSNIYEQQTAVRLLLIVSTQHSHVYYQTISELLRKCYVTNQGGLGAVIRIIGGQTGVVEFPGIKPGLQMVLEDVLLQEQFQKARLTMSSGGGFEALNTFKNLNILTKMLKKNSFPYLRQQLLINVLTDCLPKILQILEVTVTKLAVHMHRDASVYRSKFRKAQSDSGESKSNVHLNKKAAFEKGASTEELEKEDVKNVIKEEEMKDENKSIIDEIEDDEDKASRNCKRLVLAHTIIDLLNTIEAGSKTGVMGTSEVLKLAVLTVKYFFVSFMEKASAQRLAAVNRALMLLQRQCCARKTARSVCLRELVEGALFYYGYLFGQYDEPEVNELDIPEHEMVLLQNQRQSLGPNANRTVLHAGVIGRGLRPENILGVGGCDSEMQTSLLKALDACCADLDKQNMVEGYTMISMLLVEMISTDVMYNKPPFPDEEFTKVTMERDLLIRRAFTTSPILWALLGFVATHRPALCTCSVLLRALCATSLHQWRAKNVNKYQSFNANEELLQCTQKLLKILAMGQLLPPPLSNLHMIIEYFEAPEIALLLKECVWNYLKDHAPSKLLFPDDKNGLHWRNPSLSKIKPQYVDTLRNLMQKKLNKLGNHYYQMFIMDEINESNNTDSKNEPPPMTPVPSNS